MTELERREAALALLRRSFVKPGNFQPPALRLLWRMGVNARPPHFCGFLYNTLFSGGLFAIIWGSFMWLTLWHGDHAPLRAAGVAALTGLAYGLIMAGYYAYGKHVLALPSWDALDATPVAAQAAMAYAPLTH
jgi:hypothetical protein